MRPALLIRAVVLAALAAIALSGCGGDGAAPTEYVSDLLGNATATVTIETFEFQPDPLVVDAGTTITFRNEDAIDHTVTAGTREAGRPDVFDGQLPEQGATFELTLDEAGTYPYFCNIHPGPGMTGQITVR